MEESIQDLTVDISWSQRKEIGLQTILIVRGCSIGTLLQRMYFWWKQSTTSLQVISFSYCWSNFSINDQFSNIFAIIGDFGLATCKPYNTDQCQPQVSSISLRRYIGLYISTRIYKISDNEKTHFLFKCLYKSLYILWIISIKLMNGCLYWILLDITTNITDGHACLNHNWNLFSILYNSWTRCWSL